MTNFVKIGDTIQILNMLGEPQYTGTTGIVRHIDDIGQLHGSWGGCAVIPDVDNFRVLVKVNDECTR